MLHAIAPLADLLCQALTKASGAHLEVLDPALRRIAASGLYACAQKTPSAGSDEAPSVEAGQHAAAEPCRNVLHSATSLVLTSPRSHQLCQACPRTDACRKSAWLCTPIVYQGRALGSIGLACFNAGERERLLANLPVYTQFVEQMAATLAERAGEQHTAAQVKKLLGLFLNIANTDQRGLLLFTSRGEASYCNARGRALLGIRQNQNLRGTVLAPSALSTSNGECEVTVNGQSIRLQGRLLNLGPADSTDSRHYPDASPTQTLIFYSASPQHTFLNGTAGGDQAATTDSVRFSSLASLEAQAITRALNHFGRSAQGKQKAARALGIGIATLYRKIKNMDAQTRA